MKPNIMKLVCQPLLFGAGLAVVLAFGSPAHAEDKCKGQEWPNQTRECIDQIVAEVCKAAGGTNCDKSQVKTLIASGTIKATSSSGEIRRALKK